MFGLHVDPPPPIDSAIHSGQVIAFGGYEVRPHHTPGHCPGGVCLQIGETRRDRARICSSGDTLFAGSIGRTDLPGGDYATLLATIRTVFSASAMMRASIRATVRTPPSATSDAPTRFSLDRRSGGRPLNPQLDPADPQPVPARSGARFTRWSFT